MTIKITLTLLVLGLARQAYSCKCDGERSVKESFTGHSIIVDGKVVSKQLIPFERTMDAGTVEYVRNKLKKDKTQLQIFQADSVYEIRLLVKESFKGSSIGDTLTIYTRTSSCGFRFQLDREYIVYTLTKSGHYHDFLSESESEEKFEKENTYWAHGCTRTTLYDNAEATELRQLQNKKE
jgi:hypothetical protein